MNDSDNGNQSRIQQTQNIFGKVYKAIQIGIVNGPVYIRTLGSDLLELGQEHKGFLFIVLILQLVLSSGYFTFHKLHQIPLWYWGLSGLLLLFAATFWYGLRWLKWTPRNGILIVAICLTFGWVVTVGIQTWRVTYPQKYEPQQFVIAIAELGEGGNFRRTSRSRELSTQAYENLCSALKQQFFELTTEDPCMPTYWSISDSRIVVHQLGIVSNSTLARSVGKRIGADIVVWGQVVTSTGTGTTIRFDLLETSDRAVNPEYPIILPVTITSTSIVIPEVDVESEYADVKKFIAEQSTFTASYTLGLAAYLDRDYPTAITTLEQADSTLKQSEELLEMSPSGKALIYFYLAKSNHALGRIEEGLEWLEVSKQYAEKEPAIPLSLALGYGALGQVSERADLLDQALILLDDWLDTHPEDTAALYDRGIVHQINEEPDHAALDFEAVLENTPDHYIAHISLGQVYLQMEDYDAAEHVLQNAIDLALDNEGDPSWAYLNLAVVYQTANDQEKAREEFTKAIGAAPDIDWMYYYYARFLETQGEMDAALEAYQTMAKVSGSGGWAYGQLADFLKRRGLYQDAIQAYIRALHEEPGNTLLYAYLGESYLEVGEFDRAIQAFDDGIALEPQSYYLYASYGNVLFKLGDYDRAVEMYEQALRFQPFEHNVMLNLGLAYQVVNQNQDAINLYKTMLALQDQLPAEALSEAQNQLSKLSP